MNQEQKEFLSLLHLPGRFTVLETSWYLGFPASGIPLLTRRKLLIPTGKPGRKAIKLYNYTELRRHRHSQRWMHKASSLVYRYTADANRKACMKRKQKG